MLHAKLWMLPVGLVWNWFPPWNALFHRVASTARVAPGVRKEEPSNASTAFCLTYASAGPAERLHHPTCYDGRMHQHSHLDHKQGYSFSRVIYTATGKYWMEEVLGMQMEWCWLWCAYHFPHYRHYHWIPDASGKGWGAAEEAKGCHRGAF